MFFFDITAFAIFFQGTNLLLFSDIKSLKAKKNAILDYFNRETADYMHQLLGLAHSTAQKDLQQIFLMIKNNSKQLKIQFNVFSKRS